MSELTHEEESEEQQYYEYYLQQHEYYKTINYGSLEEMQIHKRWIAGDAERPQLLLNERRQLQFVWEANPIS